MVDFTDTQLAIITELRLQFSDPPTEAMISLRHNILTEEVLAQKEAELEKIQVELEQDLDVLSELQEKYALLQITGGSADDSAGLEREINLLQAKVDVTQKFLEKLNMQFMKEINELREKLQGSKSKELNDAQRKFARNFIDKFETLGLQDRSLDILRQEVLSQIIGGRSGLRNFNQFIRVPSEEIRGDEKRTRLITAADLIEKARPSTASPRRAGVVLPAVSPAARSPQSQRGVGFFLPSDIPVTPVIFQPTPDQQLIIDELQQAYEVFPSSEDLIIAYREKVQNEIDGLQLKINELQISLNGMKQLAEQSGSEQAAALIKKTEKMIEDKNKEISKLNRVKESKSKAHAYVKQIQKTLAEDFTKKFASMGFSPHQSDQALQIIVLDSLNNFDPIEFERHIIQNIRHMHRSESNDENAKAWLSIITAKTRLEDRLMREHNKLYRDELTQMRLSNTFGSSIGFSRSFDSVRMVAESFYVAPLATDEDALGFLDKIVQHDAISPVITGTSALADFETSSNTSMGSEFAGPLAGGNASVAEPLANRHGGSREQPPAIPVADSVLPPVPQVPLSLSQLGRRKRPAIEIDQPTTGISSLPPLGGPRGRGRGK